MFRTLLDDDDDDFHASINFCVNKYNLYVQFDLQKQLISRIKNGGTGSLYNVKFWISSQELDDMELVESVKHQQVKLRAAETIKEFINFMLYFMVTLVKIDFVWLTPTIAYDPTPASSFAGSKNKYARCVAYVLGQI